VYQIPALANEYEFESFICELFNKIHETSSFQTFGVKGQSQKGIDILGSIELGIVIQCKKKNIEKSDEENRESLIKDFTKDLHKTKKMNFKFKRFILASTYKDDAVIQEFVKSLVEDSQFEIEYWGWETIEKYLIDLPGLLKKYYPQFKLNNRKTLGGFELWENDGTIGFDYTKIISGLNNTIGNCLDYDCSINQRIN
jgi:hypothetical protein